MTLRCASMLVSSLLLLACGGNTIELETDPGGPGSSVGDASEAGGSTDANTVEMTTISTSSVDTSTTLPPDTTGDTTVPGEPITMLLAISTNIDPSLPFQAIVVATPTPVSVDLTLQWLTLDVGSTTSPREPIGDVLGYPDIPIDGDGGFIWDVGELFIPGAANPITGSDVQLTATAQVTTLGSPYCGLVTGEVLSPIMLPLDGSTMALTEIDDPAELPLDFPVTCSP